MPIRDTVRVTYLRNPSADIKSRTYLGIAYETPRNGLGYIRQCQLSLTCIKDDPLGNSWGAYAILHPNTAIISFCVLLAPPNLASEKSF